MQEASTLPPPRAHADTQRLKYAYTVLVESIKLHEPTPHGTAGFSLLWTRGTKTAATSRRILCGPEEWSATRRTVDLNEEIQLVCTLLRDACDACDEAPPAYAQKMCSFALVDGAKHTLCKGKVDVAPYADVPTTAAHRLSLPLTDRSRLVATAHLHISSSPLEDPSVSDASSSGRSDEPADHGELSEVFSADLPEARRAESRASGSELSPRGAASGSELSPRGASDSESTSISAARSFPSSAGARERRATVGAASSFSGGDSPRAGREAQLEAQLMELNAELAASQSLARRKEARAEVERAELEHEMRSLRAELSAARGEGLRTANELRQQAHEARTAAASLAESRAEIRRLKGEKESLTQQLKAQTPGMADYEDCKVIEQQSLRDKLDRSEAHREEVARKLGKARKHQQSLLAQARRGPRACAFARVHAHAHAHANAVRSGDRSAHRARRAARGRDRRRDAGQMHARSLQIRVMNQRG